MKTNSLLLLFALIHQDIYKKNSEKTSKKNSKKNTEKDTIDIKSTC